MCVEQLTCLDKRTALRIWFSEDQIQVCKPNAFIDWAILLVPTYHYCYWKGLKGEPVVKKGSLYVCVFLKEVCPWKGGQSRSKIVYRMGSWELVGRASTKPEEGHKRNAKNTVLGICLDRSKRRKREAESSYCAERKGEKARPWIAAVISTNWGETEYTARSVGVSGVMSTNRRKWREA